MIFVWELIVCGDYVAIMSCGQFDLESKALGLVALPIDLSGSTRPIGLTHCQEGPPTQTQAKFLDLNRRQALARG